MNEDNTKFNSGKVWVKDGKVFVKDPAPDGEPPTITPCDGIDLQINGNTVTEKTKVYERDEIILIPQTTEKPGSYRIKFSKDRLSAELEMEVVIATRYIIEDAQPQNNLLLRATARTEPACPFTQEDIYKEIAVNNISYGLLHGEIQDIITNPKSGIYLIAEGDAPGKTVDERVELNFATGPEEHKTFTDDNGKVDYRDIVEIPSVEPGALLAVKHDGVQGSPGKGVNGDVIPVPAPQVVELEGGRGVEISSEGNKAYAKIHGRPTTKKVGKRYIIEVDPVLHKKGDVDMSSGNIRFKGDVVVHGNVSEGMIVQATGNITVKGMTFSAQIAAQGDITVGRNITGSSLVAGGNIGFFRSLNKTLETIHSDFVKIIGTASMLSKSNEKLGNVKTGQLIQLIIDSKYKQIPTLIAEMIKFSNQNAFIIPTVIMQFLDNVEKKLSGLNILKIERMGEMEAILSEMENIRNIMKGMAANKADIKFGYAVNSRIEASGDVKVEGRGCINSTIIAGGNVNVKGVFRGGEIRAGGDVVMNEAGSEMCARTLVSAGGDRKILIRKVHEGVRLKVGKRIADIRSVQNNVQASLDKDGMLLIT